MRFELVKKIEAGLEAENFEDHCEIVNCLLKKLKKIKFAFQNEEIDEKSDQLELKINKLKPGEIDSKTRSHFGHILGQLNGETGFIGRLADLKKRKEEDKADNLDEKIEKCQQRVEAAKTAIVDYFDMCLSNESFFKGEISSKEGYFGDKVSDSDSGQKVEELNVDKFVIAGKKFLEEEKSKLRVVK